MDYELEQYDVETAFLNSDADNDIYVKSPPGWIESGTRLTHDHCLKLLKALYGLKQSPRLWQTKLRTELAKLDFHPMETDNCVYINRTTKICIVTYVDDFLVLAKKGPVFDKFKEDLHALFDMQSQGEAKYFLGVRIVRDRVAHTISLCQDAYIDKVLDRFGMSNCKSATTPFASGSEVHMVKFEGQATSHDIELYQSICGSLQYLATQTRWDIAYHCSVLAKFLTNPSPQHIAAAKRVMQYLQGTRMFCLVFGGQVTDKAKMKLYGFCDSDWAGARMGRVSHSGAAFFFAGAVFAVISKRQTIVALSSTEAEYVAMCKFAQEAAWIRQVLQEMGYNRPDAQCIEMNCDSQGALSLAENPEYHQRTKHIDIKYHYVRSEVAANRLDLYYVQSKDNAADGFTKPLSETNHVAWCKLLGLQLLDLKV